ncbi:MalM family protein [Alkalimarinus coralli]|uniref:MalM family protein n=1 Tax=Alkalimarinus coralli TaxID=2935863 RepID=UPI00202B9312|nr:MalM family protein [Alkalimarinus coralli]
MIKFLSIPVKNAHYLAVFMVGIFILSIASLYSPLAQAEKYFTWVDEMGRVNHTLIPEEDNPLIKYKREEKLDQEVIDGESYSSKLNNSDSVEEKATSTVDTKKLEVSRQNESTNGAEELVLQPDEVATTDKRAINDLEPEPDSVTPSSRKIVINEEDYVDGDLLLEQGGVRSQSDLPYYTWTDEQGRVRNTPYQPAVSNMTSKAAQPKKTNIVEYSVYEEYRRGIKTVSVANQADEYARELFFGKEEENFIDAFAKKCCEELPKESPDTLTFEDSVYVEIDKKSESFNFAEGKSPFQLFLLPNTQETYSLSLKTFVKSSGKTGVKNGVFFPQLVFLDDNFEVVRIIRNPSMEFSPENWRRHGYLKGLFKINGVDKERYVLINTTKKILLTRNQIRGSKVINFKNQKTGSLELEIKKI